MKNREGVGKLLTRSVATAQKSAAHAACDAMVVGRGIQADLGSAGGGYGGSPVQKDGRDFRGLVVALSNIWVSFKCFVILTISRHLISNFQIKF